MRKLADKLACLFFLFAMSAALAKTPGPAATYDVRVVNLSPPKLAVRAVLPVTTPALSTAQSRPGDVPELNDGGWAALVTEIEASGADGQPIALTRAGPAGWSMERGVAGRVTVKYVVDYALLAKQGWPAAREAAFADATHAVMLGRSLFLSTPQQGESVVRFALPRGWRAVVPWEEAGSGAGWRVPQPVDLVENLVVLAADGVEDRTVGRFRIHVVSMGRWQQAREQVLKVVDGAIKELVQMMGSNDRGGYTLVLLPIPEGGGESFRSSFAMSSEDPPSAANVSYWGNLIAHEFFHYWNGSRMDGADYASTNWIREGFTEYAANMALTRAGVLDEAGIRAKLAKHVDNYGKLTTPLDAPGDHKGPPLYSGGALVAFCWDAKIRQGTQARGIGDVLRALWRRTESGTKPYTWDDIRASLDSVSPGDWDDFHRRFIHGTERLPLDRAFASMGLRLTSASGGVSTVEIDPAASKEARSRWQKLIGARR
jgi:predicted metalloprotease with PDZ domain